MILIDWFDQNDQIGTPGRGRYVDPVQAMRKVRQLVQAPTITSVNINYGSGRQYWSREVGGVWKLDYAYDSATDNVAQPA